MLDAVSSTRIRVLGGERQAMSPVPFPRAEGLVECGVEEMVAVVRHRLHGEREDKVRDVAFRVAGRDEGIDIGLCWSTSCVEQHSGERGERCESRIIQRATAADRIGHGCGRFGTAEPSVTQQVDRYRQKLTDAIRATLARASRLGEIPEPTVAARMRLVRAGLFGALVIAHVDPSTEVVDALEAVRHDAESWRDDEASVR